MIVPLASNRPTVKLFGFARFGLLTVCFFAKTLALIAYEGAASFGVLLEERQALFVGGFLSVIVQNQANKLSMDEPFNVYKRPLVEGWLESQGGKHLSDRAKELVMEVVAMDMFKMSPKKTYSSYVLKVAADAFYMALGTGNNIQDRVLQYLNLRTERFTVRYLDQHGVHLGWTPNDYNRYAQTYLAMDDLLGYISFAPNSQWGRVRWFQKNYYQIFRKVK